MQLKRDTDYALRILLCAAKRNSENEPGMTLSEFSKNTAVPLTIAARLCRKLTETEFLKTVTGNDRAVRYMIKQSAFEKTVLNVICAVEEQGRLFAVFDRSTELYAICKEYFDEVDRQLSDLLSTMTIGELLQKGQMQKMKPQ